MTIYFPIVYLLKIINMESLEKIEHFSNAESLENFANNLESGNLESNVESATIEETSDINDSVIDSKEQIEWYNPGLEQIEIVTDLEMTEGIAACLESVEEIRYENWSKLSLEERAVVLNRIEQKIAEIERRPAVSVYVEDMDANSLGYHSNTEHKIALNAKYVGANNPNSHREVIDTIIHEGRHAYQRYNVDVKCIHESVSEVKQWEKNFYDPEWGYYSYRGQKIYIPFNDGKIHDVGFRLYANQPVEIDARNFAADVLARLEDKGIVTPSQRN